MRAIKERVWFWINRNRRNPLVARFAKLCKNIHRASEHATYDVTRNGEMALVKFVTAGEGAVIFDVGANVGNWCEMAAAIHPLATIHSFEINPRTAATLRERCKDKPNIHPHLLGLGAENGTFEFFCYDGDASELSSLKAPLLTHVNHRMEKAEIRRGDDFCRDHGIERIALLKVDAEGADYDVLSGFKSMLRERRIGLIQFEHEGGRFLKDFHLLLEPFGYRLGKLYSNYVDFRDHDKRHEQFLGPNYIAVLATDKVSLESLGRGWN